MVAKGHAALTTASSQLKALCYRSLSRLRYSLRIAHHLLLPDDQGCRMRTWKLSKYVARDSDEVIENTVFMSLVLMEPNHTKLSPIN